MNYVPQPLADREPLRILAVLPTINLYGGVLSVTNMLDEFMERGHSVKLCTLSKYASAKFMLRYEPIYLGDNDGHFLGGAPVDIVIATAWNTVDIALRICDDTGAVPVYFVQDIESDFVRGDDEKVAAALQSYVKITTKIVKTDYLRSRLQDLGHNANVIVPGVNLNIFYPRNRSVEPSLRVLAMARPNAPNGQRGFDILVKAFHRLSELAPDLKFGFFGEDDLTGADLGFSFVNFGRLSSSKLAEIYSWADVYVDASRFHGFGRTGVEAMACGAVAVLSDSGGIRDYARDAENSLVVPVGDADAIVTALLRLRADPLLRDRLAIQGRKTIEAFDDRIAAAQFLSICQEALQNANSPRPGVATSRLIEAGLV